MKSPGNIANASLKGMKILIVDDSPENIAILERTLGQEGEHFRGGDARHCPKNHA